MRKKKISVLFFFVNLLSTSLKQIFLLKLLKLQYDKTNNIN